MMAGIALHGQATTGSILYGLAVVANYYLPCIPLVAAYGGSAAPVQLLLLTCRLGRPAGGIDACRIAAKGDRSALALPPGARGRPGLALCAASCGWYRHRIAWPYACILR
jgi:hypothetical protein